MLTQNYFVQSISGIYQILIGFAFYLILNSLNNEILIKWSTINDSFNFPHVFIKYLRSSSLAVKEPICWLKCIANMLRGIKTHTSLSLCLIFYELFSTLMRFVRLCKFSFIFIGLWWITLYTLKLKRIVCR